MKKIIISTLTCLACSWAQPNMVEAQKIKYPETKKVQQTDTYFGVQIQDDYRWLENDTAKDVKQWVEAQNKVTFGYLEKIPFRQKIKDRLTELANYPRYGAPWRVGEYFIFSKNDGLQNQSVYYIQKGLTGEPKTFLDPNKLSTDGTVAASLMGYSKDKKYIAYSVSKSGSDWQEIRVKEVATGQDLADKTEWVKFSGATWFGNGFYYSRYDKPADGKEFSAKNEYHKVYYHILGTSQDKDILVYEDKEHPLRYHSASITDDDRFLILYASEGTDGSEIKVMDLQSSDKNFKTVFEGFKYNYSIMDNIGEQLLVYTNDGAPNYRLVSVNVKNPAKNTWKDVIAEKKELLEGVNTAGGKLFANYLKDVTTRIYQYDKQGTLEREVTLPALGTAGGFGGEKEDTFVFYSFTSFTYPSVTYKYDIATGKSEIFRKAEVKFNPDDFETKQVFYPSKDGTKIPMFLVYKKGLKLDGSAPTYLYGYGGFNINLTPSFSTFRLPLLENGGIYAMANLRGGGEYGEEWHDAGKLLKKQNVFDDFIAAAEYLIKEKYTSKERIAIAGGSNGGLLVGACMTQRPELFKVAFPAVGVLDMLRYHKFTIGWGWVVEYGSSERDEAEFKNLLAYSPLHTLKKGTSYPATMVTTADHDDRVVPAHSFKFAARLQECHAGKNPVLIRIETKAGHGAGKSISKSIEEYADIWAFMLYNMGVKVK
jgi:prolyl oligopeptidase